MKEFFEELWDEASDFFEDFFELLLKLERKRPVRKRKVSINGAEVMVRPAYLFAERVDNLLRVLFGMSIVISAASASFLGFSSISELLKVLIFTVFGRMIMAIIGVSYLMIALWKFLRFRQE